MPTNDAYSQLKKLIADKVFVKEGAAAIIADNGRSSPWMFDFKKVALDGVFLELWAEIFWQEMAPSGEFQVGGLEVGALPLVAAITLEGRRRGRVVNGFFMRKSRKKSGQLNQIEGSLNSCPIVLVDDLINSGRSFDKQIAIIESERRKNGVDEIGRVIAICAILAFRQMSDYAKYGEQNLAVKTLFSLHDFRHLGAEPQTTPPSEQNSISAKVVWQYRGQNPLFYPVLPKAEFLLVGDVVYFTTDDGFLKAFDKKTGNLKWYYQVPLGRRKQDIFSTPVHCGGQIIFGSRDGNLYAVSTTTGQRTWVYLEADWIQGSPAASEELGLVFAPLSFGLFKKQGKVVALETATGKLKWSYQVAAPLGGGMIYEPKSQRLVFGTEDGRVCALNAKSGRLLWEESLPFRSRGFPTIDTKADTVYLTGLPLSGDNGEDTAYLYALSLKDGTEKFVFKDFQFGSFSTPFLYDNKVYFAGLDKQLYALSALTGRLIWQRDLGSRSFASPTSANINACDYISVGANDGRLSLFLPGEGVYMGAINFTERILNKCVYDKEDKRLWVTTQANELFSLELVMHNHQTLTK